jgi:hypothetical protein
MVRWFEVYAKVGEESSTAMTSAAPVARLAFFMVIPVYDDETIASVCGGLR